jgi:vancomycin resistance protein YoaR
MAASVLPPESSRAGKVWRAGRYTVALVFVCAIAWGGSQLYAFEARPVTLEDVAVPTAGDPERLVRELGRDWYDTEVTIEAGAAVVRATRRELGGRIDIARSVREIRRARGRAPIWERSYVMATGEPRTFRWHRDIDRARLRAFLTDLRTQVSVDPLAVDRDGTGGARGMTIDIVGANAALTDALVRDEVFVRVPVRHIEAPVAAVHDPRIVRYTQVLGERETRYSRASSDGGRSINIEVAARYLNGAIVRPHEVLSFNAIVGERSTIRGFMPAMELGGGGRRVEGTGGGVCQVAATMFAAAFMSGFEIVEHHPHTRNSSYIEPGLDSAVSWPNNDVAVRNPFPFAVRVNARAYQGRLRVVFMGPEVGPRVEWSTRVVSRIPRGTERQVDRGLPLGTEEEIDEGEDGMVMERTRTIHWPDGPDTETSTLRYPVVDRLVRVGPDMVGQ